MSALQMREAEECAFDLVSLGEIMLRLDPGEGRIRNARQFRVWGTSARVALPRAARSATVKCSTRATAARFGADSTSSP